PEADRDGQVRLGHVEARCRVLVGHHDRSREPAVERDDRVDGSRLPDPPVDGGVHVIARREQPVLRGDRRHLAPDPLVPLGTLARSRRSAPGRSGPVRCSAGYPPPDAHSRLPALGAPRRAARAPFAARRDTRLPTLTHACPLSALRAGPLGPRSLLGGIPASRRSLIVARPRPYRPGRSGPSRCSAGHPPLAPRSPLVSPAPCSMQLSTRWPILAVARFS